jgi:hypothetical protein
MGNIMAPSTDAVMGAVPVAKAGVASATNDVARQVSGAMGVAVIGSVFNSAYTSNLSEAVAGLPTQAADAAGNSIGGALAVAGSLPDTAGAALTAAAKQGFVDAMGVAIFIPIGLAIIGAIVVARFLPAHHLAAAPEPGEAESAESAPSEV